MQQGYIRLYRSMIDKGWSRRPDYVAVWVYILMRGNYKDQEVMIDGQIVMIQPGQFVTSRKQMSINTGVHESKIQRILSLFENEQQIEQQARSKYRLISIVNWDKYQAREHHNEQQMNSKRTASEQQMNTDKEGKKERRKEKKNNISIPDGVSEQVWRDFKDHRRAKKAPITQTVLDGFKREADKAGITLEEAIKECCERGWQGFKAEWYSKPTQITGQNMTGCESPELDELYRRAASE